MDIVAARFNEVTHYRWGRIIDFLKLHYVLTQRTEAPSGATMSIRPPIPDRLKNLLQLWKYQPPWFFDEFDRLEEVFPAASYQYVLVRHGIPHRSRARTTMPAPRTLATKRHERKRRHDPPIALAAAEKPRSDAQDLRVWPAADLTPPGGAHEQYRAAQQRVASQAARTRAGSRALRRQSALRAGGAGRVSCAGDALSHLVLEGCRHRPVLLRGDAGLRLRARTCSWTISEAGACTGRSTCSADHSSPRDRIWPSTWITLGWRLPAIKTLFTEGGDPSRLSAEHHGVDA